MTNSSAQSETWVCFGRAVPVYYSQYPDLWWEVCRPRNPASLNVCCEHYYGRTAIVPSWLLFPFLLWKYHCWISARQSLMGSGGSGRTQQWASLWWLFYLMAFSPFCFFPIPMCSIRLLLVLFPTLFIVFCGGRRSDCGIQMAMKKFLCKQGEWTCVYETYSQSDICVMYYASGILTFPPTGRLDLHYLWWESIHAHSHCQLHCYYYSHSIDMWWYVSVILCFPVGGDGEVGKRQPCSYWLLLQVLGEYTPGGFPVTVWAWVCILMSEWQPGVCENMYLPLPNLPHVNLIISDVMTCILGVLMTVTSQLCDPSYAQLNLAMSVALLPNLLKPQAMTVCVNCLLTGWVGTVWSDSVYLLEIQERRYMESNNPSHSAYPNYVYCESDLLGRPVCAYHLLQTMMI